MKVTYNWLKAFVEIKLPPQRLAEKLTMAGLEVTSLKERDGDFVFEIETTSNRPDSLSVIGIAREVAAITGKKLKLPKVKRYGGRLKKNSDYSVVIEDRKDCLLYTAKVIRDVKAGPSPDWLRRRLACIDCRSVNNIVDITNYTMFEHGEPLHAFDLDKLSGNKIIVRRAKLGEKIVTIDGDEKVLSPDILVIADSAKAVAIAGVMGGKDTEVTEETKNILLEAAVFNPVLVRRARQTLGMQSESSYRFERGIDLETAHQASWQAAGLITEISNGSCVAAKEAGDTALKKRSIVLDAACVPRILGVSIKPAQIRTLLVGLGFTVKQMKGTRLALTIPTQRQDIKIEADLIEEVARIYGYERIPASVPFIRPQISENTTRDFIALMKQILVGLGLNEVITYSLIDRALLDDFGMGDIKPVEILNPLSKELEILRPSSIPSLAQCIARNLNQKQDYANIFEFAKVFRASGTPAPEEELVLGVASCGEKMLLRPSGCIKEKMGLLHIKGILEVLFERMGIQGYSFTMDNASEGHVSLGGEKIGVIKRLQRGILDKLDIKNKEVVTAEICLEKVFPAVNLKKKFIPLPQYPAILRDISLVSKADIDVEALKKAIREQAGALLRQVNIVDYYQGKQIEPGCIGLTISCLYLSDERTLTEDEINPVHSSVCDMLRDKFQAKIR